MRRLLAAHLRAPGHPWLWFIAIVLGACVGVVAIAKARDVGQWEGSDPSIARWFQTLRQPDQPAISCCGESDAYWADNVEIDKDGQVIAIITDDRPDEPLRRPHVPIGTRIAVPANKLKWDSGNPTGHVVIFLSRNLDVFCYVQNGGV